MSALVKNTSAEWRSVCAAWEEKRQLEIAADVESGVSITDATRRFDEYMGDSCCPNCGYNYACKCYALSDDVPALCPEVAHSLLKVLSRFGAWLRRISSTT